MSHIKKHTETPEIYLAQHRNNRWDTTLNSWDEGQTWNSYIRIADSFWKQVPLVSRHAETSGHFHLTFILMK